MGIRERMRTENLIYWAPVEPNADGSMGFDQPVQLKTRWEDELKEFSGPNGIMHAYHHLYPSEMLAVGGMVVRGLVEELAYPLEPVECKAVRIIAVANTPNVRGTKQLPEAWC